MNNVHICRTMKQLENSQKGGYFRKLIDKGYVALDDIEERFMDTVIERIAIRGNQVAKGKCVIEYNFSQRYPLLYKIMKGRS